MNGLDQDQFQPITSEREHERIIAELGVSGVQVILQCDDYKTFFFRTAEMQGTKLVLKAASQGPRRLIESETVEILFGLNDGQYLVRASVQSALPNAAVISLTKDMHRLQRRSNFRVTVPSNVNALFLAKQVGTSVLGKPFEFPITDLSAGGMRLQWLAKSGVQPLPGATVSGTLRTGSGLEIETQAVIRNLFPTTNPSNVPVGVEFKGLTGSQQQDLLFACLQIFRSSAATRRI